MAPPQGILHQSPTAGPTASNPQIHRDPTPRAQQGWWPPRSPRLQSKLHRGRRRPARQRWGSRWAPGASGPFPLTTGVTIRRTLASRVDRANCASAPQTTSADSSPGPPASRAGTPTTISEDTGRGEQHVTGAESPDAARLQCGDDSADQERSKGGPGQVFRRLTRHKGRGGDRRHHWGQDQQHSLETGHRRCQDRSWFIGLVSNLIVSLIRCRDAQKQGPTSFERLAPHIQFLIFPENRPAGSKGLHTDGDSVCILNTALSQAAVLGGRTNGSRPPLKRLRPVRESGHHPYPLVQSRG